MERASVIEAQMEGGFASVYDLIHSGRLQEAGEALKNLRLFLNTPAFRNIRSLQARRDFYSKAITSFEVLLDEAGKIAAGGIAPSTGSNTEKELDELQLKNSQLEETIADMNKTIAALSSGSSGQAQRLTELETSVSSLRTQNTSLQSSVNDRERSIAALESSVAEKDRALIALETIVSERDRSVRTLETERTSLNQTVSARDSTITELRSERNNLNNTLNARNSTISTIQEVVQGKSVTEMSFPELMESVTRIQTALGTP
jgi:chromosome segregation ATPase